MTPLTATDLTSSDTSTDATVLDLPTGTLGDERKTNFEQVMLVIFIAIPFAAILAAIPVAVLGGWIGWTDVAISFVMYAVTGHGITVGFHRYFTHGSFKAKRPLRIGLAIAGSMAIEGPVIRWVADHRKHHKFSDKEGDPHSPWRYGETLPALMKGLWYAHMGWLFDVEQTSQRQYAPDLLKDHDIVRVSRAFPLLAAASLAIPPLLGGLLTWSWQGARDRVLLGQPGARRPAAPRHLVDQLDLPRHGRAAVRQPRPGRQRLVARGTVDGRVLAQPAPRRPDVRAHGVLKGQIDSGARVIQLFETCGWAYDVRWPRQDRLDARRAA